jgi:hypothetical protein
MSCWEFIDKAYCISLKHRTDRRQRSQFQFSNIGLLDRVEYVPAEQYPGESEQGIYTSHMRCITMGLESGAQRIAVFEDDVVFSRFEPARVVQSARFLETLAGWQVFFLGCLVSRSFSTSCAAVRRVRYRSLAHAYVLNRAFAEKLVELKWAGHPFDAVLRDSAQAAYAIYPGVAFQSDARSDNHRLWMLDRFRRLCGGLGFIQAMNERWHRHFRIVVIFHLLAALVVTGWLIVSW